MKKNISVTIRFKYISTILIIILLLMSMPMIGRAEIATPEAELKPTLNSTNFKTKKCNIGINNGVIRATAIIYGQLGTESSEIYLYIQKEQGIGWVNVKTVHVKGGRTSTANCTLSAAKGGIYRAMAIVSTTCDGYTEKDIIFSETVTAN